MADALDSIGFAYRGLGDQQKAVRHYQQALAICREIGDPTGQATTLTSLGDGQLAGGQPGAARQSWEQALAMLRDVLNADTQPIEARLAQLGLGHVSVCGVAPGARRRRARRTGRAR